MAKDAKLNIRTNSARKERIIALAGRLQQQTGKYISSAVLCEKLLDEALENTSEAKLINLINQD